MHKRPQEDANCVSLTQKFYQPRGTKQPQEAQTDEIATELGDQSINDAADHSDEIECIPRVLEIVLKKFFKPLAAKPSVEPIVLNHYCKSLLLSTLSRQ